jgi:hypothetical protein
MSVKDAVLKGAVAFDNARAFDQTERAKYMTASEAMTCIRKQFFQKTGAENDGPESWGFARRGSHGEEYLVERMRLANIPMLFTGDEQEGISDEERRLSCTPDGLLDGEAMGTDHPCWLGVEFKTIDPRTNRDKLPKDYHVRQLQIAMELFEQSRDEFPELDGKPIDHGILVYMDASNFDDIIEFKVPRKTTILDLLKGRANRLLDAKGAGRLPREGAATPGKQECKQRCNFTKVCGVEGASTATGQGRVDAGDMTVQRRTYLGAKAAEAEAKSDKDKAAEQIKALLARENTTHMQVDNGTVKLATRAGSVAYAAVVKAQLPDIDLEPYRGKPSEVLTVT